VQSVSHPRMPKEWQRRQGEADTIYRQVNYTI
jgi:hypothetical protein